MDSGDHTVGVPLESAPSYRYREEFFSNAICSHTFPTRTNASGHVKDVR